MTIVEWVTLFILLMGSVVGIYQIRQLPLDHVYLTYFILITFILEALADYYLGVLRQNNLFFYHIFIPLQYSALALVFRENFVSSVTKKIVLYSIVFVLVFAILISAFLQSMKEMPFWIILITRLLLLLWVLLYLRELLDVRDPSPLTSIPIFYVCMGILIYIISLFQMGLMRFLIYNKRELATYWLYINLWFDVGFYILSIFPLLSRVYLKYKG